MTNQLAHLYLAFGHAVEALRARFADAEAMEYTFHRYGWAVRLDETVFGTVDRAIGIKTPVEEFLALAGPLKEQLEERPGAGLSPQEIVALAESAETLLEAMADFKLSSFADLPQPLADTAFWQSIGEHLFDDLLEEYLRIHHAQAYSLLHLGGVIRYERVVPAGAFRKPYTRTSIEWGQLAALARDPADALKRTYRWDDPAKAFQHQLLLQALERVFNSLRLPSRRFVPSVRRRVDAVSGPKYKVRDTADALATRISYGYSDTDQALYDIGFEVFPALRAAEQVPTGLILRPVLKGGTRRSLPLADDIALDWNVAADAGGLLAIALFPGEAGLAGGQATLQTAVEIKGTRAAPWYLVGSERSARIEALNPSLRFSVEGTADDPEVRIVLACSGANGQAGLQVVIPLGESDEFLKDSLKENAIRFSCSPEIVWSSKTGLAFNGKPKLDVDFPVSKKIGIFTVRKAKIAVAEGPKRTSLPSVALNVGLDIVGKLGPVQLTVQEMGLACDLVPYSRQDIRNLPADADAPVLGNLGLDLRFKPPTGVGVALDAGVVQGGGFLSFDAEKGEYAGALYLDFEGKLAMTALGVINTRLPGGAPGYSLVVVVTAEKFKPIPLGFGFMLTGVGGILGVHRTINIEALQEAARGQTLDAVLAPKDVVANAPQFLSALGRFFPPAREHHFFGPLAEITWQQLIRIKLALILEFGERSRLTVLGRVTAILPRPDQDLVRLQANVVGGIDFDRRQAYLDAALVDSRLANKFPITGEMRLRMRWDDQPFFALAIGGFHPAYAPPPGLESMQRAAIVFADSDNLRLRSEAYFAITSNTVQFGARVDLYAKEWKFSISGQAGYDVLIQFDPFHFLAALYASLQLKAGSRSLFKVAFDGELSGPRPLRVRGKASFEILWCDYSVTFNTTLVSGSPPPAPAPVDVAALLREALGRPASWNATLPGARDRLVSLREESVPGEIRIHPLSTLAVKQNQVPLGVRISKYGDAKVVGGAKEFRVQQVQLGTATAGTTPVRDHFAPAQFREMGDDERLTSPSFEMLEAGVAIGAQAPQLGGAVSAPIEYEEIVLPTPEPKPRRPKYTMDAGAAGRVARWRDVRRNASYQAKPIPRAQRSRVYKVVAKSDLAQSGIPTEFATRTEALDAFARLPASQQAQMQIIAQWR